MHEQSLASVALSGHSWSVPEVQEGWVEVEDTVQLCWPRQCEGKGEEDSAFGVAEVRRRL